MEGGGGSLSGKVGVGDGEVSTVLLVIMLLDPLLGLAKSIYSLSPCGHPAITDTPLFTIKDRS